MKHYTSFAVYLAVCQCARGFAPARFGRQHRLHVLPHTKRAITTTHLHSVASDVADLMEITGSNIELTPSLISHVQEKIGKPLEKLVKGGHLRECDVILSVSRNPKIKDNHCVEVATKLKGTTIVCHNESPDMYGSIDQASHALHRKLLRYKERRIQGYHGGGNMNDDLGVALETLEDLVTSQQVAGDIAAEAMKTTRQDYDLAFDDDYNDLEKPQVVPVNNFDLSKPMTVEEAIFGLDYVDHNFFVFRNAATKEISVVYKRNVGGVGLIEP